jgi:hypothetical protein
LSLEEFEASYYKTDTAVVLTGCTSDWVRSIYTELA